MPTIFPSNSANVGYPRGRQRPLRMAIVEGDKEMLAIVRAEVDGLTRAHMSEFQLRNAIVKSDLQRSL